MADTTAILWRPTPVQIAQIMLDASIREKHATRVDTTDSPVEKGVDITDHLRRRPDEITIEGLVTDHPFAGAPEQITVSGASGSGNEAAEQDFQFTSTSAWLSGRAASAHQALKGLAGSSQLFTIVTALETYQDMCLTAYEAPRDATIGEALRFTATFKEIQIVENETVTIARTQPSAAQKKNTGKKAPAPVIKSAAAALVDSTNPNAGIGKYIPATVRP